MNLEKKFREVLEQNAEPQNGDYYLSGTIIDGQFNDLSKQCVQIAKDYAEQEAIEFAEWIVRNCNHSRLRQLDYFELYKEFKKK